MQKKNDCRLYAIVDAADVRAVDAVLTALKQFSPKVRKGKTLVPGGVEKVLFIELRKREGPAFDIMKHMAERYNLYPFYVIEENKDLQPKTDKYGNDCQYFVVDCAVMDFVVPQDGFEAWQEKFRAVAKEIYRNDSVFLKIHAYKRKEDNTVHAICCNTENTNRQGPAVLGENGWKEAVLKMTEALDIQPKFRKIRYKNL